MQNLQKCKASWHESTSYTRSSPFLHAVLFVWVAYMYAQQPSFVQPDKPQNCYRTWIEQVTCITGGSRSPENKFCSVVDPNVKLATPSDGLDHEFFDLLFV